MPILTVPDTEATAGTNHSTVIQKPLGTKISIRRITLTSEHISGCSFANCKGYLRKKAKTVGPTIGLYDVRPPQTSQTFGGGAVLFDGSVEWPNGWEFRGLFRTQQTAEQFHYTIEYDIEEPEKRRRWF